MKKNLIKWLATIFVLLFVLVGCGNGGETAEENSGGEATGENTGSGAAGYDTLVVGLDDTFPPMGFRDDNGDLVGFDIDLANEVAERLDVEMDFQSIDWSLKETELEAGNIDLIWNGYTITPEREEKVLFSQPYMENSQMIVVLDESDIQTKDDLAGNIVAVQQSSSAVDAIEDDPANYPADFEELVQYPSNNDVFNDLISGRADAIVVDEVMGRYYMSLNDDYEYRVLEDNFGEEEYAVGMRQEETDLKEDLDGALQEIIDDGTYDEIYSQWFSED